MDKKLSHLPDTRHSGGSSPVSRHGMITLVNIGKQMVKCKKMSIIFFTTSESFDQANQSDCMVSTRFSLQNIYDKRTDFYPSFYFQNLTIIEAYSAVSFRLPA